MKRRDIEPKHLKCNPFSLIDDWMLLSAGSFKDNSFNMMTISWGGTGIIWGKPFFMALVRPTRHTYKFTENHLDFTVSVFPAEFKEALSVCGSKSGRDIDKLKVAGFTACPSKVVSSPSYHEAELVIECRKMYYGDLQPANFLLPEIGKMYAANDYHRMYLGEIVHIEGTEKYRI